MDPLPAHSDSHDTDHDVVWVWHALITAGATVPLKPDDLNLRHLAKASADGIDARAALAATLQSPQAA